MIYEYSNFIRYKLTIFYSVIAVFPSYLIHIDFSIIKMITLAEAGNLKVFYGTLFKVI